MKILRQDEDMLQLRPNTGVFILIFGLSFLIGGVAMLLTLGQTTRLVCERELSGRPECRFERSLLGLPLRDEPLEALQGARVTSYVDDEGDRLYKVMLVTGGGEIPLTNYSSSGSRGKQRTADEINAFVQDPGQTSLEVKKGGIVGVAASAIFFLVGLLATVFGVQSFFTTWTFSRTQGVLIHRQETVLGGKSRAYELSQIQHVVVESDSDGDTYRVVLILQNGGRVPLTAWYTSARKRQRHIADVIRGFLGLSA
jgi:hypothetical protein